MNKKQQMGMETKKRLVDCARELFSERGFNEVSVDEIIAAANSSKGSFYTHFKSKEELIYNMAPMADEEYREFAKKVAELPTAMEKVEALMQFVFYCMEYKIGLDFMSAIYAYQIKDMKTERFLTASDRVYYQVFELLLDEGKENGELKKELDTAHTVKLFTTVLRGVIYDWCLQRGEFSLAEYGAELVSPMLERIKAEQKN